MDFAARYILVKPSSNEFLQERLKSAGKDDAAIQTIIDKLPEQLDDSKISELFDRTVVNDVLDKAYKAFDEYVFTKDGIAADDVKVVEDDGNAEQLAASEELKQMDVDEQES
jgi:THO complex subunit 1